MKKLLVLFLLPLAILSSCRKETYDAQKQLQKDEQLIKDYLVANDLEAVRHESGIYYIITHPGAGNTTYTTASKVKVNYTGRFLSGQTFDQGNNIEFSLGGVILGWQIGVPLIQPGGKIRLFIPSGYAYGPYPKGGIPANSVLDFDIEVLSVSN